jgi:hypothetical protein
MNYFKKNRKFLRGKGIKFRLRYMSFFPFMYENDELILTIDDYGDMIIHNKITGGDIRLNVVDEELTEDFFHQIVL